MTNYACLTILYRGYGKSQESVIENIHERLDQERIISQWSKFPENDSEEKKFRHAIKESFSIMVKIDESVEQFLKAARKADSSLPFRSFLCQGENTEFKIGRQHFSDSFLLYALVSENKESCPVANVYYIIVACAASMLFTLAAKKPVRGGIAIAPAIEYMKNDIYGPAPVRAYKLESNIAKYPRIIVDQSVINFLDFYLNISPNNLYEEFQQRLAKVTKSFICRDTDGQLIIDFLGNGIIELSKGTSFNMQTLVNDIREFIAQQLKKHIHDNNHKLIKRYKLLDKYVSSRSQTLELI